ncbi:MAG: hypothetical protein ABIA74_05795 [bacterium]
MFASNVKKIFLICFVFTAIPAFAMAPTNFYRPYDVNLKTTDIKDKSWKFGVNIEYGNTSKGKNLHEDKANILNLWNETESSIAMLAGFEKDTEPWKIINNLGYVFGSATDDGVRGHFKFTGDFEETDLTLWGQWKLPIKSIGGRFDFCVYAPVKWMKIHNVKRVDLTKDVLSADLYVKQFITNQLDDLAETYGDLYFSDWSGSGVGDLAFILNWYEDFKQDKEYLKNVRLNIHGGLTAPTGKEKNEDKAFSLPLGNDGAWGIPLGIGLDLFFVSHVKAGLEVEILYLLDESRVRRLKTHEYQTDYFLLEKGDATKNFGLTWKFNLYLETFHFYKGLSSRLSYQFIKHEDDKLTARSDDFIYSVINSAQSLKEWTSHNFILQLNYDFFEEFKNSKIKPQASLFVKLPITGRQVICPYTFGGQVSIIF